ncbi:unnamed protein product [Caenorhabditis angaria]|uniref:C-type lectin domain-containing protein n=1 Tax=Caenorhabditis angaria TaxID=860376 RepID=A0A9P1IM46_9PELO|nr:unnamed protein product [Caenorhabditis angaria]
MLPLFFLFLLASFNNLVDSQCVKTQDRLIGQTCYTFIKSPLPYWNAQVYCEQQNYVYSTLATVANAIDGTYLASIASTSFDTTTGNFWIGLFRRNSTDQFEWQDKQRFVYSNFAAGQTSYNYVAESIINARWQTFDESVSFPFVCGYSVLPFITDSSTNAPLTESTQNYEYSSTSPTSPTPPEFVTTVYNDWTSTYNFLNKGEKKKSFQ